MDMDDSQPHGRGDSSRATTFQVYQAIGEVRTEQRLMNAKLDAIIATQQDHELRIRSVERWKLSVPVSVLLALATVVGYAVKGGA